MKSTLAVIAFLVAVPAAAQTLNGFYVGASVGQSEAKSWCSGADVGVSCDDTSTAWKVFGGYQFNRYLAAEAGYTNLGRFKASLDPLTDEAKVTAWEAAAIGIAPLADRLSAFGRLGLYRANVKETTNFAGDFENDNNDLTFGAGLAYQFTPHFGLRGEWQRYRNVGGGDVALGSGEGQKSNIDVFSLGALWRF